MRRTGFDKDSSTGLWTLNEESGTEILYGGIITGGNAKDGGGFNLQHQLTYYPEYSLSPAGKLTMTGGMIVGGEGRRHQSGNGRQCYAQRYSECHRLHGNIRPGNHGLARFYNVLG